MPLLKRGLRFQSHGVQYQLARKGIKAAFDYVDTPVRAQFGFRGQHFLEIGSAYDGKWRLMIDDAKRGALQLQYTLDF